MKEIAEPQKPNNVSSKKITKDGGTWKERKVNEFQFKTSIGNLVKIHFDRKDHDAYSVMFYVNDTQYDDASKTDGSVRDPEIIPGVIWTIKDKVKRLKAKEVEFEAQTGDGDIKNIRNLNIDEFRPAALTEIENLKRQFNAYQVTMIEPNVAIYKKLGRPVPLLVQILIKKSGFVPCQI